jgi:hypothetical protein
MDVYLADKDGDKKDGGGNGQTGVITRTQSKTKKLYKVLNDYTPMEFVVHVLERFFGKGREEATRYHACMCTEGRRRVRCVHLRNRRNKSDTGHGFCPSAFSTRCNAPWKRNRSRPRANIFRKPRKGAASRAGVANERSHEYATLEHLLLALVDDKDAASVMRACGVDIEQLRGTRELCR